MKQLDDVATGVQKTANTLRGQRSSLLTWGCRQQGLGASLPAALTMKCTGRKPCGQATSQALLSLQQVILPHLWPLQMASAQTPQCGSPLHTGQIGRQTFVKTTVNPATFPSCDVCSEKNQDFCFMGCTVLEAKKTQRGWPLVVLFLSYTHTQSPVPNEKKKKSHDLTDVSPRASNYEQI